MCIVINKWNGISIASPLNSFENKNYYLFVCPMRARSDMMYDLRCKSKWRKKYKKHAVSISSACAIDTSRTHYARDRDIDIHLYNGHLMYIPTGACNQQQPQSLPEKCQYKLKSINLEVNLMLWPRSDVANRGRSRCSRRPTTMPLGERSQNHHHESIGDWQRIRRKRFITI